MNLSKLSQDTKASFNLVLIIVIGYWISIFLTKYWTLTSASYFCRIPAKSSALYLRPLAGLICISCPAYPKGIIEPSKSFRGFLKSLIVSTWVYTILLINALQNSLYTSGTLNKGCDKVPMSVSSSIIGIYWW